MKKILVLGCLTTLFVSPAFAEIIPTVDELKMSFADFITEQVTLGTLFDVNQMKVTPQGKDFIVTLPATKNTVSSDEGSRTLSFSEKNIRLTYAGDFNGYAQYRIDSVLDTLQSLVREVAPEVSLTTDKSTSEMLWVPHYNLVSKNSQNIQNIKLDLTNILTLTIGSVVSDSLTQPLPDNKVDSAGVLDAQNMAITAEGITVSIPKILFQNTINGSPLSTSPIQQFISSDKVDFNLNIPMIVATPQEGGEPMGSLAFSSQMSYQDEYSNSAIHLETKLDKIALNKMLIPLPAIFLPTEVSLNIDIKNIQKENLNILFNQDETIPQAERQLALKNIMSTAFVQLNQLNVKNADAGVSVSGKLYNQKNNIGLPQPQADLTVVITNLDKISPEPKVDEKYCEETKEFFADKSPSDKEAAEAIQTACTPRGGFFDMWRSYLDPEKRVVNSNGTITDTLSVVLKNNVLVINGQEIQWNQMNY